MKYGEWVVKFPEDAANVTEIKSLSANIKKEDGSIDVEKIMDMSILMFTHSSDETIQITLC